MAGQIGMRKRVSLNGGHDRARMWNSMRQLRGFTSVDLAATAETSTNGARKYCKHLLDAGYLVIATPKREGVPLGHAIYRLVRNTGPVAPRISKSGLFDGNLADPYKSPSNKRVAKHANALHKSLREVIDAHCDSGDIEGAIERAIELMQRIAGDAA